MTRIATTRRSGLTLVELLVVITLIVLLAGMAVAVSQSGVFGSQKVINAADRVSGWLMIARAQAVRDGQPRGVRFLLNPVRDPALNPAGDPNFLAATEAQYIEAPEPWVPNPDPGNEPNGPRIAFVYWTDANNTVPNISTHRQVHFITTDPIRQPQDLAEFDQRVVVGDEVVFPGLRRVCRIVRIADSSVHLGGLPNLIPSRLLELAPGAYPDLGANNSGQLNPANPVACRVEYQFAFQPAPRPLLGEPTLQLTGGTIIDVRTTPPTTTYGVAPTTDVTGTTAHFDILFSPSGNVMYSTGGIICLWVRDPEKTPHPRVGPAGIDDRAAYNAAGEQSLVTVYTHTGVIATHPPAWAPSANNDPYHYAKDGMNSGL
jgi:prepilin-type N-terminal cleavage/methylation domain-containing protein